MKKKEIQQIAKKIALYEMALRNNPDSATKQQAEIEIVKLCAKAKSVEDMEALDEAVQEILEKIS